MRKVILSLAVSLDGYIEGPKGEYDWCFTDQDYGLAEFMKSIDALFIGRKSYELMETMEEGVPGMPPMQEYVFSSTLTKVKEGAILIKGDLETEVRKIKDQNGKDIWLFGGAELTKSLMDLHLVDEFHLAVHPILLGAGKLLWPELKARTVLELFDSKTYSSGLVFLKYRTGFSASGRYKSGLIAKQS